MIVTVGEISGNLSKLNPDDAETLWGVISRPHMMRFWPPIRNTAEAANWLSNGSVCAWLNTALETGFGLGMVSIADSEIDGRPERVLSYAFDRCLAGRAWAVASIRTLAVEHGLGGTVCLIGPAMANSERVAKALGFIFEREIDLLGVSYRLFRHGG